MGRICDKFGQQSSRKKDLCGQTIYCKQDLIAVIWPRIDCPEKEMKTIRTGQHGMEFLGRPRPWAVGPLRKEGYHCIQATNLLFKTGITTGVVAKRKETCK
ncbi:hypothetical protein TNCV_1072991 [Trichonephila clavipes]|nr:hypothetical protein TNCV_1072991 [Trichonephila clavipes]